uniref:Tc1-like transposase DDE domain-containing protein n=1 Tax=Acrobeloides nanus TaxID=290746 RepID=A0A914E2H1_9BILA
MWAYLGDGASAHKAEATQALIAENCPDHISVDISPHRANGDWTPNSPDLNARADIPKYKCNYSPIKVLWF